jgi:hypothetical protein
MAHFAQLKNNIVQQIVVVNNEVLNNAEGLAGEELGVTFLKSLFGEDTDWKQTSYNNNFRDKFAGIGYIYDAKTDKFIAPEFPIE